MFGLSTMGDNEILDTRVLTDIQRGRPIGQIQKETN